MKTSNGQPLSPHLQIYRLPLTAWISIVHRATGVVLSFAAIVMVWLLASAASGPASYNSVYLHLASWYGQLFLFGVTFSLYIHFCNGIRHLFWDVGIGFDLDVADRTAKLAIVAAILLTCATWLIAINAG